MITDIYTDKNYYLIPNEIYSKEFFLNLYSDEFDNGKIFRRAESSYWFNDVIKYDYGFLFSGNVFESILTDIGIYPANRVTQTTYQTILSNLVYAYQCHKPLELAGDVNFYRNFNLYYDHVTGERILTVINLLIQNDLVIQLKGVKNKRFNRYAPSEKLHNILVKYNLTLLEQVTIEPKNYVYLYSAKDKNDRKKLLLHNQAKDYKVNEVKAMNKFLKNYNDYISSFSYTFPDKKIKDKTFPIKKNVCLARIFNNSSFRQGGRFYRGGYQGLSESERLQITINGEPVIELDFSGMHPMMLYHLEGIDFKGDIYSVLTDDKTERKLLKLIVLILINAKIPTLKGKVTFLCNYLKEEYFKELKRQQEQGYTDDILLSALKKYEEPVYIKKLIKEFYKMHKPIEKYIGSGMGINLQYFDSRVAAAVMENQMKQGIPVLCVHDSFLVPVSNKIDLSAAMEREYERQFGYTPILK